MKELVFAAIVALYAVFFGLPLAAWALNYWRNLFYWLHRQEKK